MGLIKNNHVPGRLFEDIFISGLFYIIGGCVAMVFYVERNYTFFYQFFLPESILWACGYDFAFPKQVVSEFISFIDGASLSFNCDSFSAPDLYERTGEYAKLHPYLTWSVAILWRLFGVDYKSLTLLIFILWGGYTSGLYLLFRQFLQLKWSFIATLLVSFSPVMAHMIGSLRDFSKAPFIIWTLYFLIHGVRQSKFNELYSILSIIFAGATVGIGVGFRSDLFAFLPFGCAFILIGVESDHNNKALKFVISKIKYILVFIASFFLFSYPLLNHDAPSGLGGIFAMQGMTQPFDKQLKLDSAAYTNGWAYSDELTLSSIAAYERSHDHSWDQKEQNGVPGLTNSQTFYLGNSHYYNAVLMFPADTYTKLIKSVAWMLSFPVYVANSGYHLNINYLEHAPQKFIFKLYNTFKNPLWLYVFVLGFLSLLFDSYLKSKSYFIAILFIFIAVSAMQSVQFDFRHFFYLEFLSIICAISIFFFPFRISRHVKEFKEFAITIAVIVFVLLGGYYVVVEYQKHKVENNIKALFNLPKIKIPMQELYQNKGIQYYSVRLPEKYRKLIGSKNDSMTPSMRFQGTQWDVRSAANWYYLSTNSVECLSKEIEILIKYHHTPSTWQPLDSTLKINGMEAGEPVGLLFPGFYRPSQYFSEIGIPDEFKACKFELYEIDGESAIPYSFTATVSSKSNKLVGPVHKGFGGFK